MHCLIVRLSLMHSQESSLGADAGEEGLGGLVGRVLRDELAAEGALEDGAAERRPSGAARARSRRGARRSPRAAPRPRATIRRCSSSGGSGNLERLESRQMRGSAADDALADRWIVSDWTRSEPREITSQERRHRRRIADVTLDAGRMRSHSRDLRSRATAACRGAIRHRCNEHDRRARAESAARSVGLSLTRTFVCPDHAKPAGVMFATSQKRDRRNRVAVGSERCCHSRSRQCSATSPRARDRGRSRTCRIERRARRSTLERGARRRRGTRRRRRGGRGAPRSRPRSAAARSAAAAEIELSQMSPSPRRGRPTAA